MPSYTIGIDIEANASDAISDIQQTETSLLDLEQGQDGLTSSTNAATEAANKQNNAFGELKGQVTNLLVAYAGIKGVQLVGEMLDTGNAVNIANQTFINLVGGVDQAHTALNAMRTATGGVVTDYDLMGGANRLLLMGLVQTGDEAARMTEIAVTLGRAMGHDASESIESFAALLANQSTPRLDNFGISSDKVRQRIDELKASGMGAQEAFSMAVMEQGALSLDKLGTAAQAAVTPVDQLKVSVQNLLNQFQGDFATGVNSIIGLAQYATGNLPQQQSSAAQAQQQANDMAAQIVPMIAQAFELQGDNLNPVAEFVNRSLLAAQANPELAGNAAALTDKVLGEMGKSAKDLFGENNLSVGDLFANKNDLEVLQLMADATLQYKDSITQTQVATNEAAATQERFDLAMQALEGKRAREHAVSYYDALNNFWQSQPTNTDQTLNAFGITQDSAQAAAAQAGQMFQDAMIAQGNANQELGSFMMQAGDIGTAGQYGTQDQADAAKAMFEDLSSQFDHLKELSSQGLISDEDIGKAEALKDQAKQAADQFQTAADNLANIKMPDIFGQTGGGLQGQITDDLIKQMQASGNFKPEEITAMQQKLDLQSGRQTVASQTYNNDVLTLIQDMSKTDPEAAATAVANYAKFLELAAQKQLTPEQIAGFGVTPTGFGYTGQPGGTFTIQPGQTPGEVAAANGITVDQLLAYTGAGSTTSVMPGTYGMGQGTAPIQGFSLDNLFGEGGSADVQQANDSFLGISTSLQDMVEPAQSISDNFTVLNSSASTVANTVGQLSTDLLTLAAGTHKIDVELNITNLGFINSLVTGQGGTGGTTPTTVRDNGGQVAGTDNRTGPQ